MNQDGKVKDLTLAEDGHWEGRGRKGRGTWHGSYGKCNSYISPNKGQYFIIMFVVFLTF
jgi:hypothetical protein